ncbi:MAG: SpoIIE family protein phosphatase [Planctomycetes bacterium]|nr:SpoIIE family protein phosphatase [Planctomycetota bacterium]
MGDFSAEDQSGPRSELHRARSVQLTMLPQVPVIDTLEIAASYRACDMLGGDFYDFIIVDAWHLGIVIADVSGHGTAAALLMAAAKKVLQLCGRGNVSPRQVLLDVNDSIRADIPQGMFLSMLYGVIDVRDHSFCYASCGHNPPILRRGTEVHEGRIRGNAPVLGIMPSARLGTLLREEFVQLQSGDLLFYYTDGLTEAFNAQDVMYGEKRLMSHIQGAAAGSSSTAVAAIRADVDAFRGGAKLSDDETLLAIRVARQTGRPKPLVAGGAPLESALPQFDTPLIGRETLVEEAVSVLRDKSAPVLSLIGPAGAGKSRVGAAALDAAQSTFPGGIHYVDLQRAESVGDVCREVATALRLGDDETRLGLRIAMALQSPAGRSALLMDNCERARDGVRLCVEEWCERAEQLQLVVTSRVPLDAKTETCLHVKPLATPRPGKDVLKSAIDAERYHAVQLFVERAREADRKFSLTDQNYQDVAHICARLDGLPQAIQFAAARAGVLSPRQILERLDKRFELLRSGQKDDGSTLQGTLAMSWDLLPEHERQALMLLSRFPDGFQLETAGPVLGLIKDYAPEDLVDSLARQSLLHSDVLEDLGNERRFRMYESVRAFGLERLKDNKLAAESKETHERVIVDYARHWWKIDREKGSAEAHQRVQLELQALLEVHQQTEKPDRRAWCAVMAAPILHANGDQDRAMEVLRGGLADLMPGSEEWVWINVTDAMLRLNEAPEHAVEMLKNVHGDSDVTFTAMLARATALQSLGRVDEAIAVLQEAGQLRDLSSLRRARLIDRLGQIYSATGRPKDARKLFENALRLLQDSDDQMLLARVTFNLGWVNMRGDRAAEAVEQLQSALDLAQQQGDRAFEANALGGMALALHLAGERQGSEACMLRGLRLSRELGRTFTEVTQLNTLTRIYHEQMRDEDALRVATKACELAREIGARKSEALAEANIAALSIVLGRDISGAEDTWRHSYQILVEIGEVRSALGSLSNLGVMLGERWKAKRNNRDLQSSIDTLTEATQKRREHGYDALVDAELLLAELLVETGRRSEAKELLAKTLESAKARGDDIARKTVVDGEKLLAELETQSFVSARNQATKRSSLPGTRTRAHSALPAGPVAGKMPTARGPRGTIGQRRSNPGSAPPRVKAPPAAGSSGRLPTVKAPPKAGSSSALPVVPPPPKADSNSSLPTVPRPRQKQATSGRLGKPTPAKPAQKKTISSNMPAVKGRRPKGPPGAAPRRRPRGYDQ